MCNYRPKSKVQSLFLRMNLIMIIMRNNKHNPPIKPNLNVLRQVRELFLFIKVRILTTKSVTR